jgi:hypothetical protein
VVNTFCCEFKTAHVGICFRNDPGWTLSMAIRNADLVYGERVEGRGERESGERVDENKL